MVVKCWAGGVVNFTILKSSSLVYSTFTGPEIFISHVQWLSICKTKNNVAVVHVL